MEILTNEIRIKRNMSLAKLAKLTGISSGTLWNMENKKVSPTIQQLETIAIALDCKITDLFDSEHK